MSHNVLAISDASFETDVIESEIPVLVDFWAEWCNPCKALAPVLADVAQNYQDKVKFVKLDVDANPLTPPKFGVRGIPTLILFSSGQVSATQVGFISKQELTNWLDKQLA